MFLNNGVGQPRFSIFRANGEKNNRRLAGIDMNPVSRMFASDVIKRSVASHMRKMAERLKIVNGRVRLRRTPFRSSHGSTESRPTD